MSERRLQEPSAIKLVLVWDMGHTLKDRSSNIVAAPSKIRICTDYFEHGKGSTFSLNILYCELEASRAKGVLSSERNWIFTPVGHKKNTQRPNLGEALNH
mmetsp:Transcript_18003/g.24319  ORF Transcript_18003/g.24319 Transcript_18003/m.24319 type:complete len:100 (-) Transcript_18003:796-1095(-)|eukprot:CAMPEP_0185767648 /NCGR_PEP_ID=MMETSP1174-20130828/45465_1 /TAXON_ID=35687 /ORGANISM="Dictyocha speculum, Strain CCMP1381" /LENGTH=99 /DNA_ID=CAMNT_0028451967 /DNA_START=374 /DNA_END=673 /DNA_ORIENTATION=-